MKKITNDIFKIFLNLLPNKYLRAKLKADWTKAAIKKYAVCAHENFLRDEGTSHGENSTLNKNKTSQNSLNEIPPVFQYWEQGLNNAPEAIKLCTASFDKFEPEMKHIMLDFKTIEDYVEIPSFVYDKKKKGLIKMPQFSDILRSCLLAQRPALWADSTILLTGKIPDYIKKEPVFLYKRFQNTPEKFAGANFFIWSKAPNRFTVELQNAILEYWKENDFLVSYFTHPHFITLLTELNTDIWDKIPRYDEMLTLNLSFSIGNNEGIKNALESCPIHKLSYKKPEELELIKFVTEKNANA